MVSDMLEMYDASGFITSLLFALAAGLGVMNTMLMATYERMREFGIIKALGASGWRILREREHGGPGAGRGGHHRRRAAGHGWGLVSPGGWPEPGRKWPTTFTIAGMAFDPVMRALLTPRAVIIPVAIMWVVCLVSALYPASLAARLDPVKVIHRI